MSDQIETQVNQEVESFQPEAVEAVSPQGGSEEQQQGEQGQNEAPQPKRNRVEERFGKYAKKVHVLTETVSQRDARIAELEAQVNQFTGRDAPDIKPDSTKYSDLGAYEKDLLEWNTRQVEKKFQTPQSVQTQVNPKAQVEQERKQSWDKAVAELVKESPEVDQYTNDDLYFMQTCPAIADVAFKTVNPRLVKYLKENPEIVADLHDMSYDDAVFELGGIVKEIKSIPQKKTTNALPPARPVSGGGAKIAFDYENCSPEDYIKKRNEEIRNRKLKKG